MSSGNLPFSMEKLMEQCGRNKMVVEAVMDEFLNQVPEDMTTMEKGVSTGGDLLEAGKAAHRLKGTAGTFGADKLHGLCARMEVLCKESNGSEAQAVYAELKVEAQACVNAVPEARATL